MTISEMYQTVLDLLNKEKTGTVYPEEFEIFINLSQQEYVKNKYTQVEQTEKRIDDLRMLKSITTGILPSSGNTFTIPSDYMFMLAVAFRIKYKENDCHADGTWSDYMKAKPMRSDRKYAMMNDPWSKPTDDRLYYDVVGNKIRVITNTPSVAKRANFEYLRTPVKMEIVNNTVDCELSNETHQEIVDICTRKILEMQESGRYASYLNENNNVIT
jgi:hypothetical protein|tara:strand:- start:188 stop:832 length:645 start_codon:yes stop_codon:yes gene_type:complete